MKKLLFSFVLGAMAMNAMAQAMSPAAKEAHTRSLQCLSKYSAQLDDGVSNVETIAKVVANSCREESVRFVDIWTAGVVVDKQAILSKVLTSNVESASFYILSNRASKK
ncbi:hypothetical protein ACN9MZ_02495 [Pseudoduganella sp. S-14]|uniref:hypothetical protein n=1 Tax=Pseudoduganella sp. S-14 TaxID=3404065 RepID=UPI003CEBAED5